MIKLFNKKDKTTQEKRNEIINYFFNSHHHSWISANKYLKSSFEIFFNSWDDRTIDFFYLNESLIFAKSEGILSCAIQFVPNSHVILIYPDLSKMLSSIRPENGIAILFHEIGHLFHNHGRKKISSLEAQLEADHFAYKHNYGHELQDVITQYGSDQDSRLRIHHLSKLLKGQNLEN